MNLAAANEKAIYVKNVSVQFEVVEFHHRALKVALLELVRRRKPKKANLKALQNVSFEVDHGQTLGVIGGNGAGKSTLLRVINGVISPSAGSVRVNGKLSPVMDIEAGFEPDLTGMENLILTGLMLGLSRMEIKGRAASIVAFSELGSFIDAPVRIYSTGMRSRLGFAIAAEVHPDVLIIDEALSVGDLGFQKKCLGRIAQFKQTGATIVLVTHDLEQVKNICDTALWLNHGQVAALGNADAVVARYTNEQLRQAGLL